MISRKTRHVNTFRGCWEWDSLSHAEDDWDLRLDHVYTIKFGGLQDQHGGGEDRAEEVEEGEDCEEGEAFFITDSWFLFLQFYFL